MDENTAMGIATEPKTNIEMLICTRELDRSNASHELRTPLSLIKGYADEMTAGYAGNSDQKELYISIIAEEAAKMNRLLKEMLGAFA